MAFAVSKSLDPGLRPDDDSHPWSAVMQMLKLSISLPDGTHPDMELRVSTDDTEYDVVIAMPARAPAGTAVAVDPRLAASREEDDYVLGGYAGI